MLVQHTSTMSPKTFNKEIDKRANSRISHVFFAIHVQGELSPAALNDTWFEVCGKRDRVRHAKARVKQCCCFFLLVAYSFDLCSESGLSRPFPGPWQGPAKPIRHPVHAVRSESLQTPQSLTVLVGHRVSGDGLDESKDR